MKINNNAVIGFFDWHIGASKKTERYEDWRFFGTIKNQSGLNLSVAIVSDGIGGGNLGERAARLTVETIVKHIENSTKLEHEIQEILGYAIGEANKEVYRESRLDSGKSGMSATVSIAIICNRKLYVANVGDSRIYLIRENKTIKQITVDHTMAFEEVRKGTSPEKVFNHPNANHLTRSVGYEPQVIIDFGLYLEGGREDGKKAFSNQGLILDKNDVVLVCSDGLIKETAEDKKRHYVEESQIVDVIRKYHAEEVAKVLIGLAVGNNVDDNVTAVIMEFTGRKIISIKRQRTVAGTVVSIILLLALLFIGNRFLKTKTELDDLTQSNDESTQTSLANTIIALSYTPTPTATPRPTLIPGEVGALIVGGVRNPFLIDTQIFAPTFAEVHVNHTGEFEDGKIYLYANSRILFKNLPSSEMNFIVFPGSNIFVYPGRYDSAGMHQSDANIDFTVSGSCLALDYQPDTVVASCFEGKCNYQINYGESIMIPLGKEVALDARTLLVTRISEIPVTRVYSWADVLPFDSHAKRCVAKWLPVSINPTSRESGSNPSPSLVPTDPPVVPTDPPVVPTDPPVVPTDPPVVPTDPPVVPTDPPVVPTDPPVVPTDPPVVPTDPPVVPPGNGGDPPGQNK